MSIEKSVISFLNQKYNGKLDVECKIHVDGMECTEFIISHNGEKILSTFTYDKFKLSVNKSDALIAADLLRWFSLRYSQVDKIVSKWVADRLRAES